MAVLALQEVVVDSEDPRVLAVFWAAVFDTEPVQRGTDWAYVESVTTRIRIAFQRVPELKSVKNRVHLDLEVDDIAQERVRLESLGATAVGTVERDDLGPFQVMTDPEGNEFCLVTSAVNASAPSQTSSALIPGQSSRRPSQRARKSGC